MTKAQEMRQAKTTVRMLLVILAAACLSLWFYPTLYVPVVLVLAGLPWAVVLLLARYPTQYFLFGRRNKRQDLTLIWLLPGLALDTCIVLERHTTGWQAIAILTILISLIITIATLAADPNARKKMIVIVCMPFFGLSYGYGTAMSVDTLLDRSPGEQFRVTVQNRHISCGGRGGCSYRLTVPPWGRFDQDTTVNVRRSFYDTVAVGDTVCTELHPGFLRIPWYQMVRCA